MRDQLSRFREMLSDHYGRERIVLASIGPLVICLAAFVVVGPVFTKLERYGMHDWDSHAAYRYITTISLTKYGEAPLWNPYFCGGYVSWSYVEGATNFVSPYLIFYLITPLRIALRLELLCSALVLMTGIYLLAGRFTKSPALRSLAVVVGALNGRWALQAAAGHTWHLQYAWVPVALYLFDVAIAEGKRWYAVWCGVVLALMVYMGAIYPLPHAVLILGFYGALYVVMMRTTRPIVALAIAGFTALGLAAPKLLPLMEAMSRTPRLVPSTEAMTLGQLLTFFTLPHDRFDVTAIPVPDWPWHEYGIYIGWGGLAALLLALVVGGDKRTYVMKITAIAVMLLGAGAFHEKAPWTLLHKLPVFASQHVPTRFLYPGVMLLVVALAGGLEGFTRKMRGRFGMWSELALVVPVIWLALDIGGLGHGMMARAFVKVAPPTVFNPVFEHLEESVAHYTDNEFPEQGPPVLLPMMANRGVLRCYGIPDAHRHGAIARTSPRYRGEAYVAGGEGVARIVEWSPNKAVVDYWNLGPNAAVIFNMNYDEGWLANGKPADNVDDAVGAHLPPGNGRVVFRYFPKPLGTGLWICAATLVALGAAAYVARRRRRATSSAPSRE